MYKHSTCLVNIASPHNRNPFSRYTVTFRVLLDWTNFRSMCSSCYLGLSWPLKWEVDFEVRKSEVM